MKSIDKVIESCIDPKLLLAVASQAPDSVDEEDEEEVNKAFKLKSARSSIKGR